MVVTETVAFDYRVPALSALVREGEEAKRYCSAVFVLQREHGERENLVPGRERDGGGEEWVCQGGFSWAPKIDDGVVWRSIFLLMMLVGGEGWRGVSQQPVKPALVVG